MQHFDAVADAPNGVQKLRELILQLAVRGKLVSQDRCEEPEANRLSNPVEWEAVELGTVANFVMGQAPPGPACNTHGEGTVFVKAGEFGALYPIMVEWTTEPLKFAQTGDVLICVVGATAGKLNLAIDCAIGRSVAAIRPGERLLDRYLYRALQVQVPTLRRGARGSAQGVIKRDDLHGIQLSLPPLPEQRRIVEKVDQLMALCDELEEREQRRAKARVRLNRASLHHLTAATDDAEVAEHWHRIRDNFNLLYDAPETVTELRQTILQMAVRGKLVVQGPNDEPAAVLLEKIEAEKERLFREGRISRPKPLPPIEAEVPSSLPPGWVQVRFGDAVNVASGVTKGRKLNGRDVLSLPYLRVANVQRGALNLDVVKDIEIPAVELERFRLEPGDLLMTEGGDWDKLGRAAIWRGEIPVCLHQNHVFRARPYLQRAISRWFELLANSPDGKAYFQSAAKQTTNLASINMTQLRNWPCAIPPLAEQRRIVDKVDQLMSLCDEMEAKLTRSRTKAEKLASAVVHQLTAA
jgi:type I restriction enzyme S subunit